jgi:hypothetical protein
MPLAGFEPTFPAFERAKTVHDLDRAATVIGGRCNYVLIKIICYYYMGIKTTEVLIVAKDTFGKFGLKSSLSLSLLLSFITTLLCLVVRRTRIGKRRTDKLKSRLKPPLSI